MLAAYPAGAKRRRRDRSRSGSHLKTDQCARASYAVAHMTDNDRNQSTTGNDQDAVTLVNTVTLVTTRGPASADRTARRQFRATGQLVSRTQASNAMTSRLPRYEAKCVQRRCFQCGSVPLRSDIKGTDLPHANILIPLERQLIALQPCR